MNKYSLKFENSMLETQYIQQQNKQQILHVETFLTINLPILTFLAIICGIMEDYIILGITLIALFNTYIFHKSLRKFSERNIIFLYEFTIFANPFMIFVSVYFGNFSQSLTVNAILWLIIEVQSLVITSNFILAAVQFITSFIIVFIMIQISFGFTLYNFIWIPLFMFCMHTYYKKIRNKRLLFQESQVNQSICITINKLDTLIKETNVDDIMYFKLNQETLKYELEFTNIDNFDLNHFLASILIERRVPLKEFLYTQINNTNQISTLIQSVIGYKNLKEKIQLSIYIQYYPQLKFYLRVKKQQNQIQSVQIQETKILYDFYKKLINKSQKKPNYINASNFMNYLLSLNAQIQLERILSNYKFKYNIKQFSINDILNGFCKNMQLSHQINQDQNIIFSRVIFETFLYFLLRIIKQTNKKFIVVIDNLQQEIHITISFDVSINIRLLTEGKFSNKIQRLSNILSSREFSISKKYLSFFIEQHLDIPFQ